MRLQQPLPELALSAGASSGAAAGRTREHRRLVPLPRTAPRSAHSKPSSRLSLLLLKSFATIMRKKSRRVLTGSCGDASGLVVVVTGVLATTGMREALAGSITVAGTVTTLGALRDSTRQDFTSQGSEIVGFELDQTAKADSRKVGMCKSGEGRLRTPRRGAQRQAASGSEPPASAPQSSAGPSSRFLPGSSPPALAPLGRGRTNARSSGLQRTNQPARVSHRLSPTQDSRPKDSPRPSKV